MIFSRCRWICGPSKKVDSCGSSRGWRGFEAFGVRCLGTAFTAAACCGQPKRRQAAALQRPGMTARLEVLLSAQRALRSRFDDFQRALRGDNRPAIEVAL